jgi:murein L,D-transpeptidase YcbB/YkuD
MPRSTTRQRLRLYSRAWLSFIALILLVSACNPGSPTARRLEARLKSIRDLGKQDLSRDEMQQALARQMRVAPVLSKGGKNLSNPVFPSRETLTEFYANNGRKLVWSDDVGELRPAAETLLDALQHAREDGLDPEDYALNRLTTLKTQIGKTPLDDDAVARLADFDLLMTATFLRYASDLSTGRVHPDEIRDDWHADSPELVPLAKLSKALEDDRLAELLKELPPPHAGYARLREALKGLREIQAAGGWPVIPDGPSLEPGSRGPRVALLRQRLFGPAGEGRSVAHASSAGVLFDAKLAEAVRGFQKQNGIEPDGKVGRPTLAELNVPVERRIRQVELNLERWRWIPRRLGEVHVIVNIPGFEVELVRRGVSTWRSRIVVGKSFTPTPVFSDRIVAIVANPPWNVPESIALAEYLPELQEDPKELERLGLRLFEGTGDEAREVDPAKIDWNSLDEGSFPYHLRQDPGPDNALGRLKFQLTNEYQIYLHDTPAQSLFGKADRDLSHGCIRVEKPLELAEQLLSDSSRELLDEALSKTEERHVPLKPPVPIHILYLTAWIDEDGVLSFGSDIYGLDGPQGAALDRIAPRVSGGPASDPKLSTRPPTR